MAGQQYLLFAVGKFRPQDSARPDLTTTLQVLAVHAERGAVFIPVVNLSMTLPPFFAPYAETRKNKWHYEIANPGIKMIVAPQSALSNPADLVRIFKNQNQDLIINLGPLMKGK